MLLTRKQKPTKAMLRDVGKAASRIAEDSRSVAQTARSELGGLGSELRDQASDTMTQARLAAAARLAGAAQAVEPSGKRRRRGWRLLIPAVLGGVIAAKIARRRREQEQGQAEKELADELSEQDVPSTSPTRPQTSKASKSSNARTPESATR